uniref:Uncharacterized protein n=1 Tax=Mycobacterium leprae TaxID=1769 RepID=O32900_MYCLR|nr:hypothetical protein MLCB1779.40 [Mycobacterium leprae]
MVIDNGVEHYRHVIRNNRRDHPLAAGATNRAKLVVQVASTPTVAPVFPSDRLDNQFEIIRLVSGADLRARYRRCAESRPQATFLEHLFRDGLSRPRGIIRRDDLRLRAKTSSPMLPSSIRVKCRDAAVEVWTTLHSIPNVKNTLAFLA